MRLLNLSLVILLSFSLVLPSLAVQITTPQTASRLVQELLNDSQACTTGSIFSNCSYTGAEEAAGIFSDGLASGFDIDSGIILSTGKVADATGPNFSDGKTTAFNLPGDTDLNTLSAAGESRDAAVLEFDFLAQGQTLSFQYIFASEEYNEFTHSDFRDVFGFFLNDTADPNNKSNLTRVSINSINKSSNAAQFVNNDFKDFDQVAPLDTEYDGFTRLIEASASLTPGNTYHFKMAIADVRDAGFDSAVLIKGFSTLPPKLQVTVNAVETANGATLDFGSTDAGRAMLKYLTFGNIQANSAALSLSNVSLPTGFSLLDALPRELAAGTSVEVRLRLDAMGAGSFNGRFSVTNNDADNNPFILALSGQVQELFGAARFTHNTAVLANQRGVVDFGTITQGASSLASITLENIGNADLNINSSSLTGAGFTLLNAPSGTLLVNETRTFQIRLDANAVGHFSGQFSLNSDDPGNNPYRFRVVGAVQAAQVVTPPASAEPIPTLSEWAMILLSLLLFLIAARHLRAPI